MNRRLIALLLPLLILCGCASVFGPPLQPGDTEKAVIAKYGKPTARYQDGNTTLLEYASFFGQQTYMVRLDEAHRFMSRKQVLTVEQFAAIAIGKDNMQTVLLRVGQPSETSVLPLKNETVWSYRYKESGVWDSMMHIKFNPQGIVSGLENGMDPLYIPRD